MLPKFRQMPVSLFRERMAFNLDWVKAEEGHLYLTHHGTPMVAIVPIRHAAMLDDVASYSVREMRRRESELIACWRQMREAMGYEG